jgi:hypothetical protein
MRLLFTSLIATTIVATSIAATLKFDAPAGWVSKTPSSTMRVAEWTLPAPSKTGEDATLTLYFFGAAMGGNAQANIDRWVGQMAQPDGKPSKDVAKISMQTNPNGLKTTTVDVSGTYVAEVTPGSAEHFNKAGWRQIAVLVETPGGPYFVKAVGPSDAIAKWEATIKDFLNSIKYE